MSSSYEQKHGGSRDKPQQITLINKEANVDKSNHIQRKRVSKRSSHQHPLPTDSMKETEQRNKKNPKTTAKHNHIGWRKGTTRKPKASNRLKRIKKAISKVKKCRINKQHQKLCKRVSWGFGLASGIMAKTKFEKYEDMFRRDIKWYHPG